MKETVEKLNETTLELNLQDEARKHFEEIISSNYGDPEEERLNGKLNKAVGGLFGFQDLELRYLSSHLRFDHRSSYRTVIIVSFDVVVQEKEDLGTVGKFSYMTDINGKYDDESFIIYGYHTIDYRPSSVDKYIKSHIQPTKLDIFHDELSISHPSEVVDNEIWVFIDGLYAWARDREVYDKFKKHVDEFRIDNDKFKCGAHMENISYEKLHAEDSSNDVTLRISDIHYDGCDMDAISIKVEEICASLMGDKMDIYGF